MKQKRKIKYTCTEYREEMRLLALLRRLEEPDLTAGERESIRDEVRRIEELLEMG